MFRKKVGNDVRKQKDQNIYWVAKLYSSYDENIKNAILKDFKDRNNKNKFDFKNVIICLNSRIRQQVLNDFIEQFITKKFFFIFKKDGNSQNDYENFPDIRAIKEVEIGNDLSLNQTIFNSILWKIDCYYNQRGNELTYSMDQKKDDQSNDINERISINYILTGLARSGKSTFVNYRANELLSVAAGDNDPVTNTITNFYIPLDRNDPEKGYEKFCDTPGVTSGDIKTLNLNGTDVTKNSQQNCIEHITKVSKTLKDKLEYPHIIMFFMNEGSDLSIAKRLIRYLNDKKYDVLFIVNRATKFYNNKYIPAASIIQFFKNNHFENLAIEENIIPVNLESTNSPGGSSSIFGIKNLYKRIYKICCERNQFEQTENFKIYIKYLKEHSENLIKEVDENKIIKIKEEINKKYEEISDKNLFFKFIKNTNDLKNKAKKGSIAVIAANTVANAGAGFIPFGGDLPVVAGLCSGMLFEIGAIYGYDAKNLPLKQLLNHIIGKVDNEPIEDLEKEERKKEVAKRLIPYILRGGFVAADIALEVGKVVLGAFTFGVGYVAGSILDGVLNSYLTADLGDKTIKFFEKLIDIDNGIKLFMRRLEVYKSIMEKIKDISESNELK